MLKMAYVYWIFSAASKNVHSTARQWRPKSWSLLWFRCYSEQMEEKKSKASKYDNDATIPAAPSPPHRDHMVPKRDPLAVLKALSNTVGELEHELKLGRSLADPLAPKNRREHMEFLMALESGKKAGDYFIERWPKMFTARQREPDPRATLKGWRGTDEENLKSLIEKRRTQKALKVYQYILAKGGSVSLDTQNSLLRLLAYYGWGNSKRLTKGDKADSQDLDSKEEIQIDPVEKDLVMESVIESDVVSVTEGTPEASVTVGTPEAAITVGTPEAAITEGTPETSVTEGTPEAAITEGTPEEVISPPAPDDKKQLPTQQPLLESVWSLKNEAEAFFEKMSEKDGGTYDAMIPAMVKFKAYKRAFQMYEELRKLGYQASRESYNSLLSALQLNKKGKKKEEWNKAKDLVMNMADAPMVQPDAATFNILLQLCTSKEEASKETALMVMEDMKYLGIEPNLTTFLRLLQVYWPHLDGSILYDIIDHIENNDTILTIQEPDDIQFFTAAISTARVLRDINLSMRIKNLAEKHGWLLTQNVEFFLSHYLLTLCNEPDMSKVISEYNHYVPKLYVPREWIYVTLLKRCDENSNPDQAIAYMKDVQKFHVRIKTLGIFRYFFGALSGDLDPEKLSLYSKEMERAWRFSQICHIKPTSFIIGQLVRISCLTKDMHKARETYDLYKQFKIEPSFKALASLLSAYADEKDRDNVMTTLQEMKKCGFRMTPNDIRAFVLDKMDLSEDDSLAVHQMFFNRSSGEHIPWNNQN